jgi:hypothetical protein
MQLSRPLHDPLAAAPGAALHVGEAEEGEGGVGAGDGSTCEDPASSYTPGGGFDFSDVGVGVGAGAGGDQGGGWEGGLPVWEATYGAECVSLNALGEVVRWYVAAK